MQREVERLQRSLAARDSLIQQLKTQRLNDTPAREVRRPGSSKDVNENAGIGPIKDCTCSLQRAWLRGAV